MEPKILKLETDGDQFEIQYWPLFIRESFPSYEKFWLKFVVPLTNRPDDIHFKTDKDLEALNKSASDLCIAQLNYSILKHLARSWNILQDLKTKNNTYSEQIDLLTEGLSRLVGSQDNAFEIMGRISNPSIYNAFLENDGKKAREKYKKINKYPLQNIRSYRNSLLHGRLLPGIMDGTKLCLPEMDKQNLYLDWRIITQLSKEREEYKKDFVSVLNILESAWVETVKFLENNWKEI